MEFDGLNNNQAKARLQEYGLNEITEKSKNTPLKIFLRQIKNNLVIYLLLVACILSFIVKKELTAYVIILVIIIVVLTGFIQEYRAEKVISSLKNMLMPISIVIRNGKETEIPSKHIVPGDMIILRNGEKIPADCIILDEKELLVNESILTGESKEVKKIACKNEENFEEKNMIFTGCFIVNGKCIAKAVHTGMNTKFGKIADMISNTEKELPLQRKVNTISKFMISVAIIFSILTGIIIFQRNEFSETLLIDTIILVIALCVAAFPEGFPVVLTTSLSTGAYRMAKQNAIVNRMSIIETLGETTVICSDKTGTITKGEMTVKKIFQDNKLIDVTGIGYEGNGNFTTKYGNLNIEKEIILKNLLECAVLCNDARIERTGEDKIFKISGSPTEASLLVMAAKADIYKEDLDKKRLEEIPFNSERKIMTTVYKNNKDNIVYTKGALEIILSKCKYIQRKEGIFTLNSKEREKILELNKKINLDSLRTIGFAYKKIKEISKNNLEKDLTFIGFVAIEDPPRDEVKEAIRCCLLSGIKVKMITGDNKETAVSIGNKVGIVGGVMEGNQIDNYSEEELANIIEEISIFARVKPEHKLKIVRALKINSEIVTMTGDGVNDSPALKEAHIGIAMGKNGTDVSRSVSDLILKDDNFSTIVTAIKEGRTIFKNIRKFTTYLLSCKVTELSILFIGVLLSPYLGWPIPLLLAIHILFMNLVTDDLPAITLGVTPQSKDIMQEKPRKKKEILNKDLVIWFFISGITMMIITLGVFYTGFNILGLDFATARTVALVTLILVEIANAYNFISFRTPVNLEAFKANKFLLLASIISVLATLLIIYTPLNKIFSTTPLNWSAWGIALIGSIVIILIFNIIKKINHKKETFRLENF